MRISPVNNINYGNYRSSNVNHTEEQRLDAMLYNYKREAHPIKTFIEDFSQALYELGFRNPKQIKDEFSPEPETQASFKNGVLSYKNDGAKESFYDENGNLFLERYAKGTEVYYYDSGDVWIKKRSNGTKTVFDKEGNITQIIE